jgi:peptidoglycan/xylan/chitin deacetylase (PgdA/CDA1 family)
VGSGAVLAYHRVSSVGSAPGGWSVTPADFRAHMAHLAARCRPLPLDEMVEGLAAGSLPARAVAVTLDDGYLDALETASPVLEDLGIPATFFCTTDRLEEAHEPWWDAVERILLDDDAVRPDRVELTLDGAPRTLATGTPDARREALDAIGAALRESTLAERERALADLGRWDSRPRPPRATHRLMTGTEIRALAERPGHAIGAHSEHHLWLPRQPPGVRAREVAGCRRDLESVLQREVRAFAYPYGAHDEATVEAVRAAGFTAGLTVAEGLCARGADPLRLPRVEIRTCGVDALASRLDALLSAR